MSTKTKINPAEFVKSTTSASVTTGSMEVANNTGFTITWVAVEHCTSGCSTVTLPAATMTNNTDAGPANFTTGSGTDYWFVSFLDSKGNLCTGYTTLAYHSSDAGTTVEISLQASQFVVAIGGRTSVGEYKQKDL